MQFSHFRFFLVLLPLLALSTAFAQPLNYDPDKIDTRLWLRYQENPGTSQPVQVLLADRIDAQGLGNEWEQQKMSLSRRASQLVTLLQQKAASTQGPLVAMMESDPGVIPGTLTPMWITNMVEAEVTLDAMLRISLRPEVEMVYWNEPAVASNSTEAASPSFITVANGHEPGHDVINAPALWRMGYSGYAKKAMILDTGVDGTHPSLFRTFWGNYVPINQAWFDLGGSPSPEDCDGHGTHVAGTILGLNASNNDTIGVAPNGLWMGATGITDFEGKCQGFSVSQALQWALNPDNNAATTNDIPDVINNSWGSRNPSVFSCNDSRKFILDALEAAGVAVVFAAGNEGPDSVTIGSPSILNSELVNVFSVGAVTAQAAGYPIASFSSRGPSVCGGTDAALRIKPEVSAPGVNVRSAYPGGGTAVLSGTSMASPHVAGALMLLREAFPNVSGTQLKLALYNTAVDYGAPGEDNQYGKGIIDVLAAYNYLISIGNTPAPVLQQNDAVASDLANLGARVCNSFVFPFFILKNSGDNPLTQATIQYTFSTGVTGTINWTGNLPKGNIIPVPLTNLVLPNGNYSLTVEVSQPNGTTDDRPLDNKIVRNFVVATGPAAVGVPDTVCVNNRALLKASVPSGAVVWYDVPTAGTPVGQGPQFLTPQLTTSRTFYAEGVEKARGGLLAPGPGSSLGTTSQGMIFDVLESLTLESFAIEAKGIGLRVFQLFNPQGVLVASQSMFMTKDTTMRIKLGASLSPGTGYRLQVSGTLNMPRTPSVTYPLSAGTALRITGATDGSTNYYYLYDWDITYNPSCARTEVTANTTAGSVSPVLFASDTLVDLATSATVQFLDNTPGGTSRVWDFGDGNTSTSQSPVHTYTQPGTYLVSLRARAGGTCEGVAVQRVVVDGVTSLDNRFEQGEITLQPNPGNGSYRLGIDLQTPEALHITLLDLTGRQIWSTHTAPVSRTELAMELPQLAAGVYVLKVQSPTRSMAIRLVEHD